MKIAIASGKGGTGKTTLATSLALCCSSSASRTRYVDCDVEEPNGHLFLNPVIERQISAIIPVPVVDESKCDGCGECAAFCRYRAIARLGSMVMIFPELCHGCGGCALVCPQGAITEQNRAIGVVETGRCGALEFVQGRLTVGEVSSPPLIRAVLKQTDDDAVSIIDAPPGTSCPVIAALRNVDYAVLVTEPTPFGLHDLGLILDTVRVLDLPYGVVINRSDGEDFTAESFCTRRGASIIGRIPDDRRIAEACSRGETALSAVASIEAHFRKLWETIVREAAG